jgi:hypothetical protein
MRKVKKMKKIVILTLLIATGCVKLFAQQPGVILSDKEGWHKIGETVADFKTESDEIIVLGADRFESIKIKVTDASIYLVSFDIYFESGDKQNVEIGKQIKNPGETRVVHLIGGEREIEKIIFIYKTVPNNNDKKAHVELWGLKVKPDKKNTK